jgi:hypothetical protein
LGARCLKEMAFNVYPFSEEFNRGIKNAECSADFKTVEKVSKNFAQNAISQKL